MRITSIEFKSFKALGNMRVTLDHLNILVGPNNSGKSTVIGAVRCLAVALRTARSRVPEAISLPQGTKLGHRIAESSLPISLENVHTDYEDVESRVTFVLGPQHKLHLVFPVSGGCFLLAEAIGHRIDSVAKFRRQFPIALTVVPVLGAVEHKEQIREESTVLGWLATHRASRHFRSYWHHFPEGFDDFASLVSRTWPGMAIRPPELDPLTGILSMFCVEGRMTRELYWAGSGFQIWCQLLAHLCRAHQSALVVIDEPEVYLHPDVQRQLIGLLRDLGPDVLLATHSPEIVAEAEPADIILVDKARSTLERLRDVSGVQKALAAVGSIQNITLTALARSRRVLFVEGYDDFKLIRRFARRIGLDQLAAGLGVVPLESGGFGSWQRVTTLASGVGQALGTGLMIGAIYDRDYFCDEEVESVIVELATSLRLAHVHSRKEIENYLLIPDALDRAIARGLAAREAGAARHSSVHPASSILLGITETFKEQVQAQLVGKRSDYLRSTGRNAATVTFDVLSLFAGKWSDLSFRLKVVPGKEVLAAFRERIQETLAVSLSDARIVDAIHVDEIPQDLERLLRALDAFRTATLS